MTQTFAVPQSIALSKVREFLADLGIDEFDHLIRLEVGIDGVQVELYATDEKGRRYIAPGSYDAATHVISMQLDRSA